MRTVGVQNLSQRQRGNDGVVRVRDRSGIGRYRWLLCGLTLILFGIATHAGLLVAAGVGAIGAAALLGSVTVAAFVVGAVVSLPPTPPRRSLLSIGDGGEITTVDQPRCLVRCGSG